MVEAFAKSVANRKFSVVAKGNSMDGILASAKHTRPGPPSCSTPSRTGRCGPENLPPHPSLPDGARGASVKPEAGASDGWVCEISSVGSTVFHEFSHFDDAIPGKSHKVFIRVKATEPKQDGMALTCGLYQKINNKGRPVILIKNTPPPTLLTASSRDRNRFLCRQCARHPRFYIALNNAADPKVLLDCICAAEVK